MRLPSPGFLLSAFVSVFRRFPGTMFFAVLGTMACLCLMDDLGGSYDNQDLWIRQWLISLIGLPFLTAFVAYSESNHWEKWKGTLLQILGVAATVAAWFWLDNKAPNFDWQILPQYLALLLIGHLAVAFAPYLNNRPVRDFWDYNRQLFANIVVGALFSFVIYSGLALAMLAVDNLFDLHIPSQRYAQLFVVLAGIFNTSYFLYHFPKSYTLEGSRQEESETEQPKATTGAYNWIFRTLCKFVLIPIVLLYFLILYAYGAKIGLQWSLPKGWVSSLIIGFSVAGIFTYLLNFYLPEEDRSLLVHAFKRWFWWVLLPLTGLLFIAIGKRIGDYGVTEPRFLVAQLGIWLAVVCLYFLISKKDNIKFIPITLAIFALLWAFGPLSAFSVSLRSQSGIMKDVLTQYGRFENGKLKPGNTPMPDSLQQKVSSAVYFLQKRNALADLLPSPLDSSLLDHYGLMEWLNLERIGLSGPRVKTLSINMANNHEPIGIKDHDWAVRLAPSPDQAGERTSKEVFFCLSTDGTRLEKRKQDGEQSTLVETYSLGPAIEKWLLKAEEGEQYSYVALPAADRTVTFPRQRNAPKLIVEEIQIETKGDESRLVYCTGWVLFKE